MSNLITNLCRPLPMSPSQKSVLMCSADYSNDAGMAWPSIPTICEWTCLGRATVIEARNFLVEKGYLSVHKEAGENTKKSTGKNTRISFNLEFLKSINPSSSQTTQVTGDDANQSTSQTGMNAGPVQQPDPHPSSSQTTPVQLLDTTRPAAGPNTPLHQEHTNKTPRNTRAEKQSSLIDEFPDFLEGVDQQVLADWKAYRAKNKWAINETILKGLAREATKAGMSMEDVLRTMVESSWRGFKASWIANANAQRSSGTAQKVLPSRHTGFTPDKYEEASHVGITA